MNTTPASAGTTGILGIDAGGTFTDLAFMSGEPLAISARVKTPTLHDNLIETITSGVDLILRQVDRGRIRAVNLATTLATNAIVENKLRPMGLILIGYDADSVEAAKQKGEFGTDLVYQIAGGHDARGNELAPLDEATLRQALEQLGPEAEALAISGYFSVRNTKHELRAREIAQEMLPRLHITCGHELVSDLNAIKRATTASLNAGLIPIVMELLRSVEQVCQERGINAPITVVRGDGSLVSAAWAAQHPIEMVLSGPAGSACGACFLAGASQHGRSSWAVDIGGTTTDIINLDQEGKPALNPEGATVGRHKTLVKAIDIYTFGLGGDSRACYNRERRLTLGPRRVRPLCVAALEHPSLITEMEQYLTLDKACEPLFVFPGRRRPAYLSTFENSILDKLADGPHLAANLLEGAGTGNMSQIELEEMETRGLVTFAGFTPTDALHIHGRLDKWSAAASRLGARLLTLDRSLPPEDMATAVEELAVRKIAFQVFRKGLTMQGRSIKEDGELEKLIWDTLATHNDPPAGPRVMLALNAALIGVGAPAWAFMGQAGRLLQEDTLLPEGAEVAGAVGAAVGSFSLNYAVLINPLPTGEFRVHHPLGMRDYDDLQTAVDETYRSMLPWIIDRAKRAGAHDPQVEFRRQDDEAWIAGGTRKVYLRTQLFFTVNDGGESK